MKTHPFVWHNFVSRIIRAQIKLGRLILGSDALVPIIPLRRCMWRELFAWGPSFSYKGDEVVWNWRKRYWTSISCDGVFPTLAEVDRFWSEYEAHCNQQS